MKKNNLAFIKIFGCQQNEADTEKYSKFLSDIGFNFTENQKMADLILINTCAIRHTAQNRILSYIGSLKPIKEKNPNLFIVICGCMIEQSQIKLEISKKYPYVDLFLGAKSINNFHKLLYEKITGEKFDYKIKKGTVDYKNRLKAQIPIISGCNNFCSYCVVPFVRGPEKSLNWEEIVSDCENYIKNGCKDITLLGQNVNSYKFNEINFAKLIEKVDNIEGDFVLRFMTSHPKDLTKNLIDVMSTSEHFGRHLHLPVQSGNNRILSLMNRKYTREDYIKIVEYAKKKIAGLVITSDIIVGFPGETDEEFEDTISLVESVNFALTFTFIYSPRDGTEAAKIKDEISYTTKKKRIIRLIELQKKNSEKILFNMVGKIFKVLVEQCSCNLTKARTGTNLVVEIKGDFLNLVGKFVFVKIIDSKRIVLIGKIVEFVGGFCGTN